MFLFHAEISIFKQCIRRSVYFRSLLRDFVTLLGYFSLPKAISASIDSEITAEIKKRLVCAVNRAGSWEKLIHLRSSWDA